MAGVEVLFASFKSSLAVGHQPLNSIRRGRNQWRGRSTVCIERQCRQGFRLDWRRDLDGVDLNGIADRILAPNQTDQRTR